MIMVVVLVVATVVAFFAIRVHTKAIIPSVGGGFLIGCVVLVITATLFLDEPIRQPPARLDPPRPSATATPQPSLEILDFGFALGQYGNRVIEGHARNASALPMSYAQIEINFFDDTGAQVGSTIANTLNLAAGGTWKFEAAVLEDSAATARVIKAWGR